MDGRGGIVEEAQNPNASYEEPVSSAVRAAGDSVAGGGWPPAGRGTTDPKFERNASLRVCEKEATRIVNVIHDKWVTC